MPIDSLGRSGKFDELREFLRSAGYTEEFLCARFRLERAEQFELDRGRRAPLPEAASAADVLTALFLAGEFVSLEQAERLMGRDSVGLLSGMGLLAIDIAGGRCHGTVALYPLADLHIASDRWSNPDDAPFEAPSDTVYPAFIPNTRLFLAHVPLGECGSFLDLCAGTGIAAILAARQGAREAWAGDIAERCTRFAEFNGRLNGVANFHPVTSDLYGSLGSFDRIVAHPPYVPALQPKWIFFSGGEDGEEITRRIVRRPAGAPQRPRCVSGIDHGDRPVGCPLRMAHQGMARGGRPGLRHRADRQKDPRTPRVRRPQPRRIRGLEEAFCADGRGIAGLRLRRNPAEKRRSRDVHGAAAGKPCLPPRAVGVAAGLGERGQEDLRG